MKFSKLVPIECKGIEAIGEEIKVKKFEKHEWQRSRRASPKVIAPSLQNTSPVLFVSSICTSAESEAQLMHSVVYHNMDCQSPLQGNTELFKMATNAGNSNPEGI